MCIEPTELAVVQLAMERNLVADIVRNVQAIVRGVRGTRRDEMNVNDGASGPGVALVDGIAVAIDLQRAIEMRPRFNGALAVVLNFTAPKNRLAFFIGGLQFEPDIEGVYGAAGEEVSDFARAHNDVDTDVIAAADGCIGAFYRSGNGADFAGRAFGQRSIRLFANGERGREFRLSKFVARR